MFLPITQAWQLYALLAALMIVAACTVYSFFKPVNKFIVAIITAIVLCVANWIFIADLSIRVIVTVYLVFLAWMAYEIKNAPVINDENY